MTDDVGGTVATVGLALLVLVVAVAGTALVEVAIRRSDVGAGLVLGLLVFEQTWPLELSTHLGPVRVGLQDVLLVVLLTAAVARILRIDRLTTAQWLLVAFGLVVTWSLVRGFGPSDAAAAINEARKFLRFGAIALYFSLVEPRRDLMWRIGRLWLLAAALLAGLSLLRWGANAVGVYGGLFGESSGTRVLPSDAALIIGQGALIALGLLSERGRGLLRFLAPALLVVVVVLQHRTVWLATAVGLLYLLYRQRASARVLGALVAGMVMFAFLSFTVFEDQALTDELAQSGQSTATFEWRVGGWNALLEERGPEGPADVTLGRPFGEGWDRTFDGRFVDVSPHNFYLEAYLRVGLVGIALLLLAYGIAFRGPPRTAGRRNLGALSIGVPRHLVQTMVVVQLLYYLTYSPDMAQALLLGLACAAATGTTHDASGRRAEADSVR